MRITRSISINMETWERANDHARVNGMTFSGLVERCLVREMETQAVTGDIVLAGKPRDHFVTPGDTTSADEMLAAAFGPVETTEALPPGVGFRTGAGEPPFAHSRPAPKPGKK